MSKSVTQVLEWKSTDGTKRSLLIVEDTSLPANDVKRKVVEISEYDEENDQWKSGDTTDYIDELLSYGIPENLVD